MLTTGRSNQTGAPSEYARLVTESDSAPDGGLVAGILIGVFLLLIISVFVVLHVKDMIGVFLLLIISVFVVLHVKGYLAPWCERLYTACIFDDKEIPPGIYDIQCGTTTGSERSEYANLSSFIRSSGRQSSGRQSLLKGKIVYSDVGPHGGRLGPKPQITKSNYAKVKEDVNYPPPPDLPPPTNLPPPPPFLLRSNGQLDDFDDYDDDFDDFDDEFDDDGEEGEFEEHEEHVIV